MHRKRLLSLKTFFGGFNMFWGFQFRAILLKRNERIQSLTWISSKDSRNDSSELKFYCFVPNWAFQAKIPKFSGSRGIWDTVFSIYVIKIWNFCHEISGIITSTGNAISQIIPLELNHCHLAKNAPFWILKWITQ